MLRWSFCYECAVFWCSKKIRLKVPRAIYVHCYAHRLNLCLVQTLQNVPYLCNFFNTIQNFYKFLMNAQTRCELFIKAQKYKKLSVVYLERLMDTRWAKRYKSIHKVNLRFTEILEVIEPSGRPNCEGHWHYK